MILIISTEFDQNTTAVINWLIHKKTSFIRVNENDHIEDIQLLPDDIIMTIKKQKIRVSSISACWYRRGGLYFNNQSYRIGSIVLDNEFVEAVNDFKKREIYKCIEYLYHVLSSKEKSLGNYYKTDINKLVALSFAQEVGLTIPATHILSNLKPIQEVGNLDGYITKPVSEIFDYANDECEVKLYTERFQLPIDVPQDFFYSLVQKEIQKKYEIRSFFLNGKLYSMAIFSQNDNQTKVDFRRYNHVRPNRNVPFELPKSITIKLKKLMKKLGLNSGSIDLIVDEKDDFYFLEVNPVGQFGMVSYPCNYYLEKKVAEYLIQ